MLLLTVGVLYPALSVVAASYGGNLRLLAAFLVAPLVPSCVLSSLALDWHYFLFVAPFSYCFALVGFPIYFLFRWLGWLRSWQIVAAAAMAGALLAFGVGFSQLGPRGSPTGGSNALLFAGYGGATGLVFWLVAFAKRAA
jgi:hypothetical protein